MATGAHVWAAWLAAARLAAAGLAGAALFAPGLARACDSFTADGNIRLRYEVIENQPRPELRQDETITSLRTDLFAECVTGVWRIGGELVDSRAYGVKDRSAVSTNEVNVLEPIQAYVGADFAVGPRATAFVQAGRFTIHPNQRRQMVVDDYRNTVNSYTGLRGGAAFATGETVTLLAVAPQLRLPADDPSLRILRRGLDKESEHLLFWGVIVNGLRVSARDRLELSYFGLREDDMAERPSRDRRLATFSARLYRPRGRPGLDYEVEVVRQTGTISDGFEPAAKTLEVAASYARANLGYRFRDAWQTRTALEFDWGGGDGPGPKYGRFDALYTVRRPRLAPIGLYAAASRANIVAPGARVEFQPNRRLDVLLNYHRFWLDTPGDFFAGSRVRDPSGRSGRFAGDQIDARARYWLAPDRLRLEADYVLLAKGRFLREAPNTGSSGDTHYLSMNLTWMF